MKKYINTNEFLDRLLKSYKVYYDVYTENIDPPFVAEAEFSLHGEQFFLVKSVKLSEADSKEFVFFATAEDLTLDTIKEFDNAAWERGLAKVEPHPYHRNSDVILIVLTHGIREDARKFIKKTKHYESYNHSLHGWSHYKLIVADLSTGSLVYNRQGSSLKKHLNNIIQSFS